MKEQLSQEQETTAEREGDETEDTPAAKRRRLASFFVESGSLAGADNVAPPEVIVAVRKNNIVATAFHPELTNDSRWHEYFVNIVREAVSAGGSEAISVPATSPEAGIEPGGASSYVA